jgi:ectoine hydroxylase-related dioxygenase (phytanoyl-CoA dioxygenase family)
MAVLSQEQLQFFQDNGYLIVRQLNDAETVDRLRTGLMEIVDGHAERVRRLSTTTYASGKKVTEFQGIWKSNPVFQAFLRNTRLGEAAAQLLNTDQVRLLYDQCFYKDANLGGAVACHQDYDYWQYVSTPNMVTAWMAMSRVGREDGCVYVVPGTHKLGLIQRFGYNITRDPDPESESLLSAVYTEEEKQNAVRVPLILEPGDVSFHHSLLIHCSYPNTSSNPRLGYIHRYIPADARYVESHDVNRSHEIDVADGELINTPGFPLVWPHEVH